MPMLPSGTCLGRKRSEVEGGWSGPKAPTRPSCPCACDSHEVWQGVALGIMSRLSSALTALGTQQPTNAHPQARCSHTPSQHTQPAHPASTHPTHLAADAPRQHAAALCQQHAVPRACHQLDSLREPHGVARLSLWIFAVQILHQTACLNAPWCGFKHPRRCVHNEAAAACSSATVHTLHDTRSHTHAYTYTHAHTHSYTNAHTHSYTNAHKYTRTHSRTHT